MKRAYTLEELLDRLAAGAIVPVDGDDWDDWRSAFTIVEEAATVMAGTQRLVRWPVPRTRRRGWAVVEEAEPGLLAVRPLRDEAEARALIADRLAAYERMWDG